MLQDRGRQAGEKRGRGAGGQGGRKERRLQRRVGGGSVTRAVRAPWTWTGAARGGLGQWQGGGSRGRGREQQRRRAGGACAACAWLGSACARTRRVWRQEACFSGKNAALVISVRRNTCTHVGRQEIHAARALVRSSCLAHIIFNLLSSFTRKRLGPPLLPDSATRPRARARAPVLLLALSGATNFFTRPRSSRPPAAPARAWRAA